MINLPIQRTGFSGNDWFLEMNNWIKKQNERGYKIGLIQIKDINTKPMIHIIYYTEEKVTPEPTIAHPNPAYEFQSLKTARELIRRAGRDLEKQFCQLGVRDLLDDMSDFLAATDTE